MPDIFPELKCPFCEKIVEKLHPNSHILPRWLFRLSSSRKEKYFGAELGPDKINIIQSGFKGSFICQDCEKNFGEDDRYASLIFGEKNLKSKEENVADAKLKFLEHERGLANCYSFERLNFKKLQRFVLGVVMRGHMARLKDGKGFLGEKHFVEMKKIYSDILGLDDKTYPILIYKVYSGDKYKETGFLPVRGRNSKGTNYASFMGGGYLFGVVVQNHLISESALISNLMLKSDGKLVIPETQMENLQFMQKAVEKTNKLARKRWRGPKELD